MNRLRQWLRPRLDNCFHRRPVERIKFYIFAVKNQNGQPFRWFTTREKADVFIANHAAYCMPDSVLVEVE